MQSNSDEKLNFFPFFFYGELLTLFLVARDEMLSLRVEKFNSFLRASFYYTRKAVEEGIDLVENEYRNHSREMRA